MNISQLFPSFGLMVVAYASIFAPVASADDGRRPNVLFISVDDHKCRNSSNAQFTRPLPVGIHGIAVTTVF